MQGLAGSMQFECTTPESATHGVVTGWQLVDTITYGVDVTDEVRVRLTSLNNSSSYKWQLWSRVVEV
jgi:hypothetical protein